MLKDSCIMDNIDYTKYRLADTDTPQQEQLTAHYKR